MVQRLTDGILFAGHATAVIELGGVRLITDPLMRRHVLGLLRLHHPAPGELSEGIDAVLISHLHHDHLDPRSLARIGRSIPIVAPRGAASWLHRKGFAGVTGLLPGESASVGAVTVRAVEAAHDAGRALSRLSAVPLGYVLEGRSRIYFAGDTGLFDGMTELGPIDVAMLPIWGWGPRLGDGHMDPEQAALAAAMIRPRTVVPIHWGSLAPHGGTRLWPWLLERPAREFAEALAREAPGVALEVLRPGERLPLGPAPA